MTTTPTPSEAPYAELSEADLLSRILRDPAVTAPLYAEGAVADLVGESDATAEQRRQGNDLAQMLLAHCGGIAGLAATPPDELSCPGLPPPALAAVAAALEVARRLRRIHVPRRGPRSERAGPGGGVTAAPPGDGHSQSQDLRPGVRLGQLPRRRGTARRS